MVDHWIFFTYREETLKSVTNTPSDLSPVKTNNTNSSIPIQNTTNATQTPIQNTNTNTHTQNTHTNIQRTTLFTHIQNTITTTQTPIQNTNTRDVFYKVTKTTTLYNTNTPPTVPSTESSRGKKSTTRRQRTETTTKRTPSTTVQTQIINQSVSLHPQFQQHEQIQGEVQSVDATQNRVVGVS